MCRELTTDLFWKYIFQLMANRECIVGVTVTDENFVFSVSNTETVVHKDGTSKHVVVGVKVDPVVEKRLANWNAMCSEKAEPHLMLSTDEAHSCTTFCWNRFTPHELVRLVPQLFSIRINIYVLLSDLHMVCAQIHHAKQTGLAETDNVTVGNIIKKQFVAEHIFQRGIAANVPTPMIKHAYEAISYLQMVGQITYQFSSTKGTPLADRAQFIAGNKNRMLTIQELSLPMRTCIEHNPFIGTLFCNVSMNADPPNNEILSSSN